MTPIGSDIFGAVSNQIYSLGGSASESRLTPKASNFGTGRAGATRTSLGSKSISKRNGTAASEYHRRRSTIGYSSPSSIRTFSDFEGGGGVGGYQGEGESLEVIDRNEIPDGVGMDPDEEFEGLENVRACCGGKHDG